VTLKELPLRRPGECRQCGGELGRGDIAWWDSTSKTLECAECHKTSTSTPCVVDHDESTASTDEMAPHEIQLGIAGKSSLDEYQRRHDKREQRIDVKFGRFAGIVKFSSDDPQSITAWKKGSVGERLLAVSLHENLGTQAIVLSDRRVPRTRGNIDHIVVAPSGIWVVDAKNYSGLIQQKDVGGLFRTDIRLYVGGRDRSKILDGLKWQVQAVRDALVDDAAPISSAVCFTDAEWGWFAKPFTLRGVFVSGPNGLAREIATLRSWTPDTVREVAGKLSQALPPKT
jgi:hypothetical protein